MHIQTDRAFVPAGTAAVRYLQVTVTAPKIETTNTRPSASVAMVLDRSGSMDGTKLVMAREAVAHAIKLLKPGDHLGIACYDEEITTVLDRTPATNEAKKLAHKRLASIDARGSTDLHGGWMRGVELTQSPANTSDGVSKVLLLTDGLANQGVIDHHELLAAARRIRAAGVLTSTFGVGDDFDEDLLSRIATEGGGHFYFIESAKQIPDVFASELGETLEVVARDVQFEVIVDPGVDAGVINELPYERQPDRLIVRLGNLVSEQEVSFVIAVGFKGSQTEGSSLGVVCRLTDREGVLPVQPMAISWAAVDTLKDANQPVNGEVIVAVASLLAEHARRAAFAANAAGKFDAARQAIQDALNDLRSLTQLEKRVLSVIDGLHQDALDVHEAMEPTLRKQRQFASYQKIYSRGVEGTAKRSKRH